MPVFVLGRNLSFPPAHLAEKEGLLAVGGDLSVDRLLLAYRHGIFPWYSEDEPFLWWSPDPRLVLYPGELAVSRSLARAVRQKRFDLTMDHDFSAVIRHCARSRTRKGEGTWIDDAMVRAYTHLHEAGYAHSVEAWQGGDLAGGLYGVALGRCFFGESMFTRISNASKVAFVKLVEWLQQREFTLIDCQVSTAHLMRFGAREIPRKRFLRELEKALAHPTLRGRWHFNADAA
jgi:leucyl/phenylalanyl-tRNA--protein transferase